MSLSVVSSVVIASVGMGAVYQAISSDSLSDRVGRLIGFFFSGHLDDEEVEEERDDFETRLEERYGHVIRGEEAQDNFTQAVAEYNELLIESARRHVDHGSDLLRSIIGKNRELQELIKEVGVDVAVYDKLSKYTIAELLVAPPAILPKFMGHVSLALLREKYLALSVGDQQVVIDAIQGDGTGLSDSVKEVCNGARALAYSLVDSNRDFSVCVEKAIQPLA